MKWKKDKTVALEFNAFPVNCCVEQNISTAFISTATLYQQQQYESQQLLSVFTEFVFLLREQKLVQHFPNMKAFKLLT